MGGRTEISCLAVPMARRSPWRASSRNSSRLLRSFGQKCRAPVETESPNLSLAPAPIKLGARALTTPERDPARAGGRRAGAGNVGNWGAGNGQGFGIAKLGDGVETIRGVKIKVGDPQFTLIWDAKSVDIDLHVMEPQGDHLYFGHRNGKQGGELDVDNTWGYGPENIYWLVPSGGRKSKVKLKGPGPPGAYRWSVHYYASHRPDSPPIHWQVRIKHAGEAKIVEGHLSARGMEPDLRVEGASAEGWRSRRPDL